MREVRRREIDLREEERDSGGNEARARLEELGAHIGNAAEVRRRKINAMGVEEVKFLVEEGLGRG
jgi:hypothetical protein